MPPSEESSPVPSGPIYDDVCDDTGEPVIGRYEPKLASEPDLSKQPVKSALKKPKMGVEAQKPKPRIMRMER